MVVGSFRGWAADKERTPILGSGSGAEYLVSQCGCRCRLHPMQERDGGGDRFEDAGSVVLRAYATGPVASPG